MFLKKIYSRQTERIKPLSDAPVEVQVISAGAIDILSAYDISVTGIGVRTPQHYDLEFKDGRVTLVITLPGDRPFQADGVVRHITQNGKAKQCVGVEFTSITDKHVTAIQQYMGKTKEACLSAV